MDEHAPKSDAGPLISKPASEKDSTAITSKPVPKPAAHALQPTVKASMSESTRARPPKRNRLVLARGLTSRRVIELTWYFSDEMNDADKENASLDSPKKRIRSNQKVSRQVPQSQILSPKSHNSRQLPHSPLKGFGSPTKPNHGRPISPSKTASTIAVVPTAASLAKLKGAKAKPKATTVRATSKQTTGSSTAAHGTTRVWQC